MAGSRYVKAPVPTEEIRPLYEAVLKALSGAMSVTDSAALVDLSRVRFQARMNRGLHGLLAALRELPRGRPPIPERERALREELRRLLEQNEALQRQAEASARMLGLAAEWMSQGPQGAGRGRPMAKTAEAIVTEAEDEGPARLLEVATTLRSAGVPTRLAVAATGVSEPTLRRWRQRHGQGAPLRRKRGPPSQRERS